MSASQVRLKPDATYGLRFPIGEEVGVDEVIDDRLVCRIDRFELNAHADATIAPGHTPFGVDIPFRARHSEPHPDLRAGFEWARRPNRKATVPQIQREGGGNRVAEAVLNRDAENRARSAAPVEVVRK